MVSFNKMFSENKVVCHPNSWYSWILSIDVVSISLDHLTFTSWCYSMVIIQFSSVAQFCLTLCNPIDCSMPGLPVNRQLPDFTQIHVHWVSDAIQSPHPLLSLLLLPSIFAIIRVFSNESVLCIRWPKYWSFSFSISPANEYSGLISYRMDWLNLHAVQGTCKSLQHHSSKASILWHSAIFIVQFSNPYMTTGRTIVLSRWTYVGKVMSAF